MGSKVTRQQWLAETLGVEAEHHAVYQVTLSARWAKLKVARPQNKASKIANS